MEQTQNTALLVIDMQEEILATMPDETSVIIENTGKAITSARYYNIPVIYVVAGKTHPATRNIDESMKVHPDLLPGNEEVTVMRRRVSAFTGTDLEIILRSFNIRNIVLTGISTSGAILSTLCEAADKGYGLTVLLDCCADPDKEVHRIFMSKLFPCQAEVVTVDEWFNWW
ncbi:cysteine hydrolase family protein [Pedobacter sp. L105]|uniref:cysteine hydrolase family protein n=1 Tax=Pedobacter sp. L105 TaxID=1641871 RepID=UPI00131B349D|nr:cysteine hydrolase [Pedobacter sp. L105]